MISKLNELTEYSPSVLPPSVICGSRLFSLLDSPCSMASSGHFDPSQTYDGYKEVKGFDPSCTKCSKKGKQCFQHCNPQSSKWHHSFIRKKCCQHPGAPLSNIRWYLWSRKDGPFGKEFPVCEAPAPDGTSGYSNLTRIRKRDVARLNNVGGPIPTGGRPIYSSSEVPISRINSQGVVKRLRRISDSPTNTNAEGSDELDGEEAEVKISKSSNTYHPQKLPTSPFHYAIFYFSTFTKSFHCKACPGLTSEAITHPASHKLYNGHLPPTTSCGQLHKKTRRSLTLNISCHPSISAKGTLAYEDYQRTKMLCPGCLERLTEILGS
ncbi:hypothetical protein O181_011080 [Austropuccinia psidii MF-1]|uniref:Uncharacterized protein n=1 Tax=Austropuccinia psidii MF-1 TaxID=1389203 RepID=A0A9Q3BUF8_9BASI|nr:hypothetical protein [Austropuccinia psidii MF-1]